jgi:hypothetical protein
MRAREKKLLEAWRSCMTDLYAQSTPSADFDQLLESAPLNPEGQKVIDYDSYEIDHELLTEIVEGYVKKLKMNKYEQTGFYMNTYLGASPRSKRKQD